MYVLDTDILSLLFAGHPRVVSRQDSIPSFEIAITVVSRIEVLQGRFDFLLKAATGEELLRAQEWLDKSVRSLAQVETAVAITTAAAVRFDALRANRRLRRIGRRDLLIAAIVLAEGATLVTRNLKDFRQVPGLLVDNWAD